MISITHVLDVVVPHSLFLAVVIILQVAVCVSVSVGGITAHAVITYTPAGLYLV